MLTYPLLFVNILLLGFDLFCSMIREGNRGDFYKALMVRIKSSDEVAFAILFDKLWERMYALAFSLLKKKDLSKDIVQDVFVDFWTRRQDIDNTNIEVYLVKATRFRVYKELRDTKLSQSNIDLVDLIKPPCVDDALNNIELQETTQRIDKAIGNLPKKCQQVFTLSRYDELNNLEISRKLGISKRTVETHISLAIRSIKKEISF